MFEPKDGYFVSPFNYDWFPCPENSNPTGTLESRIFQMQGPPDRPPNERGDCEIMIEHTNVPLCEFNIEGEKLKICENCYNDLRTLSLPKPPPNRIVR